EQARRIIAFWVTGFPALALLRTSALEEAVRSGTFLTFDTTQQAFVESDVSSVLHTIFERLLAYRLVREHLDTRADARESLYIAVQSKTKRCPILGHDLVLLFKAYDLMVDLLRLFGALLQHIDNPSIPVRMPQLRPITPLANEVENVAASRPSRSE